MAIPVQISRAHCLPGRHLCPQRRHGFTILELIFVIGLILLLVTVLVLAMGNALGVARQTATQATLLKIDGMLQQRLAAFRTSMETPQWQSTLRTRINAKLQELREAPNNIDGASSQLAELLIVKDTMRRAFPQTLSDSPGLGAAGQPFEGNQANSAESAELLYWLITKADSFGVSPVDDSEFSSAEIADTDGDGRLEFVDNWRRPLRFYRWPTRLLRPNGPGTPVIRNFAGLLISGLPSTPANGDANPLEQDPDDRLGVYLASVTTDVLTAAVYEGLAHTPDTYWIPLIVSAGPDDNLGLEEPFTSLGRLAQPTAQTISDPANSGVNDNVTSKQKQK